MTITGANLGSSASPQQVTFKLRTKGVSALATDPTALACPAGFSSALNSGAGNGADICVNVAGSNTNNGSTVTATVLGPRGYNLFMLQKKGVASYAGGALEVDFTTAAGTGKFENVATIDSNCGTSLQSAMTPGHAYSLDANGEPDVSTATSSPSTAYYDVVLNVLGVWTVNLCTPDLGIAPTGPVSPNTVDYAAYASNYPVSFSTTACSGGGDGATAVHTFTGAGFSFPYTSQQNLTIFGVNQTYTLSNFNKKVAYSCAASAGANQPAGILKRNVGCTVSTKGVVTVTDTTDINTYTSGDTLSGPAVDISAGGKAAGAMNLVPGPDVSEIGIGGVGPGNGCV